MLKSVQNAALWSIEVFEGDNNSSENIVLKSAIEFHVAMHL